MASAVRAAVLYQLSYEDPYIGSRPINCIHLTCERNETGSNPVEAPINFIFSSLIQAIASIAITTAMVTSSFHLYLRSSHHFILRKIL